MADIINRIVGDHRLLAGIAGSIVLFIVACCACFWLIPTGDEPDADEEAAALQSTSVSDRPTSTPFPVITVPDIASNTPVPSDTTEVTIAPTATNTSSPEPTSPFTPTSIPSDTPTFTPSSTHTPLPTSTPAPTATHLPPTFTLTPSPPVNELATVVKVTDGDTIEVEMNGSIYSLRYIGIDCPEWGQPFFQESYDANSTLVAGKTVTLVKDVSETDQYGRLLRYVYLQDGTFVNAELVRQGYATAVEYPPDLVFAGTFAALEQDARNQGMGIWSQPAPTATAAPLPTNTAAPQPAEPANVQISHIYYDGQVYRVESDEYAEITNQGGSTVNLAGWRLNAGDPGQDFWFPSFDLLPGQSCRVYTNEYHPDSCGFSFGSGRAIWNNTDHDCGHLYNEAGAEVSTHCY